MASYNWDGDIIVRGTIVPGKRFVLGNRRKAIDTDIRGWIAAEDNNVLRAILRTMKLPISRESGDFDRRALTIWSYVNRHFSYVHDSERIQTKDFWLFPEETATLGQGDCEDYSFLIASLLLSSGISPYCVRVVLGEIFDAEGNSLGGHCWPMYKTEMGEWCIFEMTEGKEPRYLPKKFINIYPFVRYVPYYCFNNHHLFRIFPKEGERSRKYVRLEDYFGTRSEKVNISTMRLAAGGIFSTTVGHFDITRKMLKSHGFSDDAAHVAADASQDPDFYEFETAAAHAQTENFKGSATDQIRNKAIATYLRLIGDHTGKIVALTPRKKKCGLFYLGYTLHSIQDLAVHEGITNEQHAYLSYVKKRSPDEDDRCIAKAEKFSDAFLSFFKKKYPRCFETLLSYDNDRWQIYDKLSMVEKKKLLGSGWDMTPESLVEYRASWKRFDPKRQSIKETKWPSDKVFSDIAGSL